MRKVISMLLVISILILSTGNVLANEDVDTTDSLQTKIEEYLDSFPEDSADKEMFIREVEMLKDYDLYDEESVDKIYRRFKPIDVSSLPEIELAEIEIDDETPDESNIIRISEEEMERNKEDNQMLLDSYAEMMEGMTEKEILEAGIGEDIVKLVKLHNLQTIEETISVSEIQDSCNAVNIEENPEISVMSISERTLFSNTVSKAPMIACGDYHNVYLKADGTVWTWGDYNSAALNPMMDTYTVPTRIKSLSDIIEVSAGYNYSIALSSNGSVYAWGAYTGQGYGSRDPFIISGLEDIISIDAGSHRSLALKADGTVYEWVNGTMGIRQMMLSEGVPLADVKAIAAGEVYYYALKNDGTLMAWRYEMSDIGSPELVQNIEHVIDISASDNIGMLLTSDGNAYYWYDSIEVSISSIKPQLMIETAGNTSKIYTGSGNGAAMTSDGSIYFVNSREPEDISNVVSMSFGRQHYTVVNSNGSIWGKGYNNRYQLGLGNRNINSHAAQLYNFLDVKQIEADGDSSAILKNDGTVWTLGEIQAYQYQETSDGRPIQVVDTDNIPLTNVSMIELGENNGYALKDGMVWSWGINNYNMLGRETDGAFDKAAPVCTSEAGNPYLTDIISVSASRNCVIALDNNGNVWSWGYNRYGQLGLEDIESQAYAVKISSISNIKEISCGKDHVLALDNDGYVWSWGRNVFGQLGLGDDADIYVSIPEKISSISNIKAISCGYACSMALGEDGYVWTWGSGDLGRPDNSVYNIPVKISLSNIAQISAGYRHLLALDDNGNVWTLGSNEYGQLGDDTYINKNYPVKVLDGAGELGNVISISAADYHNIVLKSNGSIFGWGKTSEGQLGVGNMEQENDWIQVMNVTPRIVQVSSKLYHSIVLKSDGTVWASGYNDYGQLGNTEATDEKIAAPVQVMGVSGERYLDNIKEVKAGDGASFALTKDGKVLGWGYNERGKLGQPLTTAILYTPAYVRDVDGTGQLSDIIAIDTGSRHTLALSSKGKVYAWGDNTYRQLGDETAARKDTPVEVSGLADIIAISAYGNHSLALKSDGTVWAWGQNDLGQIGIGWTTAYQSPPVQVQISDEVYLSDVKKISAGYTHNAVLKSDGTVWVWGDNDCGQLGLDNTTSKYYAVRMGDMSNVNAIFAGARATYIIKDGSVLYACGQNTDFKLGSGYSDDYKELIPVYMHDKIVTICGAWNSTAAITSDGTLFMWGTNSDGQFGIGSSGNVSWSAVRAYSTGITYNDYSSSFGTATQIVPNKIVTGEIAKANEADYFKFTADFTGAHVIDVTGDAAAALYDNSQTLITPINKTYTLTSGENYYIKVTGSTPAVYTFIIRSLNPAPYFARYSFKSGFINPAEITALTSGHVEGHLVVANDYIEPEEVLVGLALYEKNTNAVHSVAMVEKTMLPQTSETVVIGLQVPSDYQNYIIKAIIWDSREGMNQLGSEIIFE